MSDPQMPLMDWSREARTGLAEAVYGAGKNDAQLDRILGLARDEGRPLLVTGVDPARHVAALARHAGALDHDTLSATAILGGMPPLRAPSPRIAIVTGGLADLGPATEAARTLRFAGHEARLVADVGVAGLWRLMERLEEIRRYEIVIAVAGMEAALFSVLAGLVAAPVIALPTSVGSGVAAGGTLALHAALGSCAPGIVAVNIDNGFGAAQAALRCLAMADRAAAGR